MYKCGYKSEYNGIYTGGRLSRWNFRRGSNRASGWGTVTVINSVMHNGVAQRVESADEMAPSFSRGRTFEVVTGAAAQKVLTGVCVGTCTTLGVRKRVGCAQVIIDSIADDQMRSPSGGRGDASRLRALRLYETVKKELDEIQRPATRRRGPGPQTGFGTRASGDTQKHTPLSSAIVRQRCICWG